MDNITLALLANVVSPSFSRTRSLSLRSYLLITVAMVFVHTPLILIVGMTIKAAIIVFWFMHLRFERKDFALVFILCLFFTALVLFGLIVPDGLAM